MKRGLLGLLLVLTGASQADQLVEVVGRIAALELSGERETVIKVGTNVASAIQFPKEIGTVVGYGLTKGGDDLAMLAKSKVALFHYQQTGKLLVVRNIKNGDPCSVTVSMDGELYLLSLVPSTSPNVTVTLKSGDSLRASAREVDSEQILASRTQFSSDGLIGVLNLARNRRVIEPSMPGLFASVTQRNGLQLDSDFGGVSTRIEEIQRFPKNDATVILGIVTNGLSHAIEFDPQAVLVRVGDRDYPAQLVDGSGMVMPDGKAALQVVLQGNAEGGKEHLSIDNDFRFILPQWKKWAPEDLELEIQTEGSK